MIEVPQLECIAGRGVSDDRFFDYKENYKGQITFFGDEVFSELCKRLDVRDKSAAVLRRNVITRGLDLNQLVGVEFEIQGGRFLGTEECKPCYWMDRAFHPGAEALMKGRGGLRAQILTDCVLQPTRGPVALAIRGFPQTAPIAEHECTS